MRPTATRRRRAYEGSACSIWTERRSSKTTWKIKTSRGKSLLRSHRAMTSELSLLFFWRSVPVFGIYCDYGNLALLVACRSDSDSEGENPEKKKLQEQLMGMSIITRIFSVALVIVAFPNAQITYLNWCSLWSWVVLRYYFCCRATYYAFVQVMLVYYHVCRCHRDGEAQRPMERCCRTRRSKGGPEGSCNPTYQIPTPLYR